ncbi:MAG TPA: SDR family NAD(P)-dependent oxidoreductase, partial [Anaeromyxobacter sp.]
GKRVPLPTYAFQRERFWLDAPRDRGADTAPLAAGDARFWQAVERSDLESLTQALHVAGEEQRSALATLLPALSSWHRQRSEQSTIDSCRYRVIWKPLAGDAPARLSGTWLLVLPKSLAEDDLARTLGQALRDGGASVVPVVAGAEADRERLVASLRRSLADGVQASGVLSLLALHEAPLAADGALPSGAATTLALVQALGDAAIAAPLWLVTRGAVSVGRSDRVSHPLQAPAWGLGRVVALEHPDRWGGLVDLCGDLDARALERFVSVLCNRLGEDELALRPTGLFARRLVRARLGDAAAARDFEPRGTVLVTGGTGAIGGHVARWLARRGAEHLVLTSRRGPDAPGATQLEAELTALGARVTIAACDAADRDALAALLQRLDIEECPVRSVFHAAGVLNVTPLAAATTTDLAHVFAAKAAGARHLHDLLGDRALDAFVLFSSGAGVWGSGQQGAYAAANAFLDALAEERRGVGLTATSVSWGLWAGEGMAADEVAHRELRRRGMTAMVPQLAIAALDIALRHDETTLTVADIDWARFAPSFAAARQRPLLRDVPEAQHALEETSPSTPQDSGLVAELRGLAEGERLRALTSLVASHTAAVLGHADASGIDPGRGFFDLGLDSLMAVELRRRLQKATGFKLPATVAFDHPSPRHVAAFLRDALAPALGAAASRPGEHRSAAAARTTREEPVALVGVALRAPPDAVDLASFWSVLEEGRDTVRRVPGQRWDAEAFYDPDPEARGKSYVRDAAFLDRIDLFDAGFFGVSPREAKHLDPQHRLLLEVAWEALEHAGVVPSALEDSRTGVFVGISATDYALLSGRVAEAEAHTMTGTPLSFAAGRLSYTLGLQGPALSVDTACSSSLVALHLACQSLRRGECDLALAAGAQLMAAPDTFKLLSRTQAVAPDGRSKTFSAKADGYGRGEGVVVVALERLSDARARGHHVLAVVRGSAVNHDGASSGITAPNGTSQQKVLRTALEDAGLRPADVDFVECHGTGTSLGDPIEVQALAAVYGEGRGPDAPLLLGAVKTNIGHLEAGAGLAGVAKVTASLLHDALPPTLHTSPLNPHIEWEALPVRVVDGLRPWPRHADGSPRRAGVSAFGISGTNAHVILEEAPPAEAAAEAKPVRAALPAVPVLVSAKGEAALSAQAERLREHLVAHPELELPDVACSLATTRSHFEHRAAIVAHDRAELLEALAALGEGSPVSGTVLGSADKAGKLAVLFTGQGSQRAGMGRALAEAFPAFRDALDAVCAHLDRELERPLREVLFAEEGAPEAALLDETAFTQPALFAIEVALFRLLESWGVRPDLLVGHSIGELAAAHVAGVLSLEDACALVAARGRLMQALPRGGAMVSLQAGEDEVAPLLAGREAQVSIAALNGPASTVVSGDEDAVAEIARHFEALARKTTRLRVSHAFHSPRMDSMLAAFRDVAAKLSYGAPRIPIVSNVTGKLASAEELGSPEYWVRHVRQAVRFLDGVRTLEAEGATTFLELGPQGVLCAMGQDCLSEGARERATFLPALRKERSEPDALTSALAALHAHGQVVDWKAFFAPANPRRVPLPTYAFQRERFWLDAPASDGDAAVAASGGDERFWQAVERGDVESLTEALRVADDPQRSAVATLLPALSSWRRRRGEETTLDSWRYRVVWKPVAGDAPSLSGTWLLVLPSCLAGDGLVGALSEALRAAGASIVPLAVESDGDRERLAATLRRSLEGVSASGVLSLLALDAAPLAADGAVPGGLALTLVLLQALGDAAVSAPLWLLTRGAVSVGRSDRLAHPLQALAWGLGRVAALEHPERWGGLVDLGGELDARALERFAAALGNRLGEDELALRPTGLFARRLVRAPLGDAAPARAFTPRGTVLVTGGTGAIGGHVARWLARRGAEHLVLASRRGPDAPGAAALKDELIALGARVTLAACDAADRDALAALLQRLDDEGSSVRAVFHLAGVIDDGVLSALPPERLGRVLRAKVTAAANLDELTRHLDLSAFVLFSSAAGVLGNAGQGNYAAANAFLDALAEQRRTSGLAATSIAWGAWAGEGMAGDSALQDRFARRGFQAIDPSLALASLERTLEHGETTATIIAVDWARLVPGLVDARPQPALREIPEAVRALEAPPETSHENGGGRALAAELASLSDDEVLRRLTSLVASHTAAVLGHADASRVDPQRGFLDLGLDSLMAVELRRSVQKATGVPLPATVAFDHPSPSALAAMLRKALEAPSGKRNGRHRAELDGVQATLSSLYANEELRPGLTNLLRTLLSSWAPTAPAPDDSALASKLRTATDEELLALLRDEGTP